MIYELKPCPFCGRKAAHEEIPSVNGVSFSVGCTSPDEKDCPGFQLMTSWPTKKDAAKAWNRRYTDATISRLTEEVERLGYRSSCCVEDNDACGPFEEVCKERDEARARAEQAEARVKELEGALAPFAKAGELFPPRDPETFDACVYAPAKGKEWSICGDHLRRAYSTLSHKEG